MISAWRCEGGALLCVPANAIMLNPNLLGKPVRHRQRKIGTFPNYMVAGELSLYEKRVYGNILIILNFQPHDTV